MCPISHGYLQIGRTMVWTVAFLAVVNMAIGYALAIYLQKNGSGIAVGLPKVRRLKSAPTNGEPTEEVPLTTSSPEPVAPRPKLAQPVEPEAQDHEIPTTEGAAAEQPRAEPSSEREVAEADRPTSKGDPEAVNDDNVLAGIEAFRSQLAKISKSSAAEEPEPELEKELVGS